MGVLAGSKILVACLMLASETYSIPSAVLVGLYKTEGGAVGQEVANTNGSYDLGPMQINTIWLPELAEKWGVSEDTAHKRLRDDACVNVNVAAWILRKHVEETGSFSQGIAQYHSRTPRHGTRYQNRVLQIMKDDGLIKIDP